MTNRFVLDENVIVSADTLVDENGNDDASSLNLLTSIITICHSIVVDELLIKKYMKKFKQLEMDSRGVRSPVVVRLIVSLQSNSSKYQVETGVPALKGEEELPEDDRPLVRLATFAQATLVTIDRRLIEKLNSTGLIKKYKIEVATPREIRFPAEAQ